MKTSKLLIITSIVVAAAAVAFFVYKYYYFPIDGWKVMKGCVSQGGTVVNYSFYAKDEWEQITTEFGCGNKYENAETFGLVDKPEGENITDISQLAIALYDSKPSTYDENSLEYYEVGESLYLEFMRITVLDTIGGNEYKISDDDWDYIKKSFKVLK